MLVRKLSEEARAAIKEAWINGASGLDLAVEYDVSKPAISYHTRGLIRLAAPRRGQPPKFDYRKALRLRQQGLTYTVIGIRLGITREHACRIVNKLLREAK